MAIHVFMNNPTVGLTDGNMVSEGDKSNPITIGPLNAKNNEESAPVKLAIRCDTGFVTTTSTVITPMGTTLNDWALAPDNAGVAGTFLDYGTALTITSLINATNTLFWVKARAVSSESPINDSTVTLQIATTITGA